MASSGIDLERLEETLKHVAPSGKFAAGAKIMNLDLRYIEIQRLGRIRLPLRLQDVPLLRDHCEQAPYSRGRDTVVDTPVHRAWQIDGGRIVLPGVEGKIQQLAEKAARNLGFNTDTIRIKPSLYKLVFYEPRGHFVKHRDTEKEPGIFGTMVLQCPVVGGHTGGELHVWHNGRREFFIFSQESSESFFFTTFFVDCEQELKFIRSGYHLCLIFNLVWDQPVFSLAPSNLLQLSAALPLAEAALLPWSNAASSNRNCPKIAVLLEHWYTEQNLSFSNLKGRDRIMADVLRCVRDSGNNPMLEVHLAILTKHEFGSAEYSPPRRRIFWNFEELYSSQYHMEEVYETSVKLKNWIAVDDSPFGVQELDIDVDEELVPPGDPFANSDPDKENYEDYTGNQGPTLEYWYRAAVLVIWPRCKTVEILQRKLTVTALIDLLEQKQREQSPFLPALLSDAIYYIFCNPVRTASVLHSFDLDHKQPYSRLIQLAVDVNSEASATRLLDILAPSHTADAESKRGIIDSDCAEAIALAIRTFTWEHLGNRVLRLIGPHTLQFQLEHVTLLYNSVGAFNTAAALEIVQKVLDELSAAYSWTSSTEKWSPLVSLLLKSDGPVDFGARYLRSVLPGLRTSDLNTMLSQAARLSQQGTDVLNQTHKTELVLQISRQLAVRPFIRRDEAAVAVTARNLFWVDDAISIRYFRQQILSSPNKTKLLIILLRNVNDLLNANPSSRTVKVTLIQLIGERIAHLADSRLPIFSWCMLKARLPGYPEVEAFLRGPESEFVLHGLGGIGHARNFANSYFNGRYQEGYSGVGTPGGRGSAAYCEIRKTRAAFRVLENKYRNGLEELGRLRQTLAEIQRDLQNLVTASVIERL